MKDRRQKNVDGISISPVKKTGSFSSDKKIKEQNIRKLYFPNPKPIKTGIKILLTLSLVFIFGVMPIKILSSGEALKAQASNAITNINSVYPAIQSGNYQQAKESLKNINMSVASIQKELDEIGQNGFLINSIPLFKDQMLGNESLLEIALISSQLGTEFIDDIEFFQNQDIGQLINGTKEDNEILFERIKNFNKKLNSNKNSFELLVSKTKGVDEKNLIPEVRIYFTELKKNIDALEKTYRFLEIFTRNLEDIAGLNFEKKYLILFENNTELRPGGGFIGTYGILSLKDGKIKDIKVDSIYNIDGQNTKSITPPEPIAKLVDKLYMRDANWNPDFSESARLISEIFENEGGFTPDGIIAIDTKPFLDVLKITGPIKLDKYDLEIGAENFIATTQYKTSIDYDPTENNPKKFLADFAPLLLDKVFNASKEDKNKIMFELAKNIKEKHISFYSPKEEIQKAYSALDITNEIKKDGSLDYFYYVNANIGGLKTNDKILERIDHQVALSNGKITHRAIIEREHTGTYEWPGGINYSYIRFYLPENAKVKDIIGFEKKESIRKDSKTDMIYLEDREEEYLGKASPKDIDVSKESGRLVVGAWQVVKPGQKATSEIIYELPNWTRKDYSIIIQKQAGIISQETSLDIKDGNKGLLKKEFSLKEDIFIDLIK